MRPSLLALLLLTSASLQAQNWSVGGATGPFVFGNFAERTMRLSTEEGSATQRFRLSAATRAGLAVDIQRELTGRYALRLEGTFTTAPLTIRASGSSGVPFETGDLDVATFALPLVINLNRGGSFRFHVLGGPAYAIYRIKPSRNAQGSISVFDGTREDFGFEAGAGLAWRWSDRFAFEGNVTDISTRSPFRKSDFPATQRVKTVRPTNVHTTVGIRYRF